LTSKETKVKYNWQKVPEDYEEALNSSTER